MYVPHVLQLAGPFSWLTSVPTSGVQLDMEQTGPLSVTLPLPQICL